GAGFRRGRTHHHPHPAMTELGGCVHRPPSGGIASGPATIETLRDLPPDRGRDLLADSEAAGSRLVPPLVDDWAGGPNRFDRPGETLFGASVGGWLVGVCGLNVDPYAGGALVGRVRHLYVLTAFRGRPRGSAAGGASHRERARSVRHAAPAHQ